MREKLNKKMLKELDVKEYNTVMERIHVYLCNVTDERLIKGALSKDKNILDASMYCYKKGSELAVKNGSIGVADVTPEMEIEWVNEYYLSDVIDKKELMKWPTQSNGSIKEKEVVKEVVKEVFVGTPTMEHIKEYLETQKQEKRSAKNKRNDNEENLSLF